MVIALPEIKKI